MDSVSVESYCDGSSEGGGEGVRFHDMLRLEDGHEAQVGDMRSELIVIAAVSILYAGRIVSFSLIVELPVRAECPIRSAARFTSSSQAVESKPDGKYEQRRRFCISGFVCCGSYRV